jgi:hypothetical protein
VYIYIYIYILYICLFLSVLIKLMTTKSTAPKGAHSGDDASALRSVFTTVIKLDKIVDTLGQCVALLLAALQDSPASGITVAVPLSMSRDEAWKAIRLKLVQQGGTALSGLMRRAKDTVVPREVFVAVAQLMDSSSSGGGAAGSIRSPLSLFASRVRASLAKLDCSARKRVGLAVEVLCSWVELVMTGIS